MDGVAGIYDKFEKTLEDILQDPTEPAISLSAEFLRAITNDFSSEIGSGGFGVVYKGVLRSGKVIAVKMIKNQFPMDKDCWSDELNRVIGITHPNVVQLIGYCAEDKMETVKERGRTVVAERPLRFLCFEYLSNGCLQEYISKEHVDLGWDKIYTIIEGICRGLHFLHQENIVHLDLNPRNILMDDDMVPKITDFGLARLLGEHKSKTYTKMATGSIGYMAPEYIMYGKISPKSDIFSLGVIIIEMITGSRNNPLIIPHSMNSNEINNCNSSRARLKKFTENVLGTWKKIFEASTNGASEVDVYIHQLEQLIDIALKCIDTDEARRPNASDILQFFSHSEADRSSHDSGCMYQQLQVVRDLLSVQPTELRIPLAGPNNKLCRSSCFLHLNNNTDGHVAFRLMSNTLSRYLIWPSFQFFSPRCRYTIAVTMRSQQNPPPSKDQFLTLEVTRATHQDIKNVNSRGSHDFFTKARDKGRQVQEVKLPLVYVGSEPEIMVVPLDVSESESIDVHPTEPWILISPRWTSFAIWDYNTQEMARFPASTTQNKAIFPLVSETDGSKAWTAKFIAQEKWILVGCSYGYIKVYSYMARQNLEGSKTLLFSEIKSFKAHAYGPVTSLEIHQTGPYVLSAVNHLPSSSLDDNDMWENPMDKIKLWDWEKGWKLVCTFDMEEYVKKVKLNPKDKNMFATISSPGVQRMFGSPVKVWSTGSPDSATELSGTKNAACLDFFSRDGELHMIIAEEGGKATIWDYHKQTCVATLKGNTRSFGVAFSHPELRFGVAFSHPELPILITGSDEGTVYLWSSSTFSLMRVLNCGIGHVMGIACLKGSRRIAILHSGGLAITEIDHDQSGAVVCEGPSKARSIAEGY